MKESKAFSRILMLLSLACGTAMFMTPSKMMILLVLAGAGVIGLLFLFENQPGDSSFFLAACLAIGGVIQLMLTAQEYGFQWNAVIPTACFLAVAGFPAMLRLSGLIDDVFRRLFPTEPSAPKSVLVLGGLCFLVLATREKEWHWFLQSAVFSLGILWAASRYLPGPVRVWKEKTISFRVMCAFSAMGCALFLWDHFPSRIMGAALAAGALFGFLYPVISAFFSRMGNAARFACKDLGKWEKRLYFGLFVLLAAFALFAFSGSEAFYGTDKLYDLIYTSDSPTLFRDENVYMWLTSKENDLRQPLFAAFCGPVVAPFYLLGRVLNADLSTLAFLMNIPMLVMLLGAFFLISKMMELPGWKRMLFVLLCSTAYPTLLFSVMMEQYIPAFFYLILLLFTASQKRTDEVWFWGASGSMLTSAVSILAMNPDFHPIRNGKELFRRWLQQGFGFAVAIIALGRMDVIVGCVDQLMELRRFSGGVSFRQKLSQFSAFFAMCFTAPNAGPMENPWGVMSWQLSPASGIHLAGVSIVLLALAGAAAGRKKPGTWVALSWMAFSAVILLILGWGCPENGLILYSLYFGWELYVLVFRLLETVQKKWMFVSLYAVLLAGMILVNIPAMAELVSFAIKVFPNGQ